MTGAVQLGVQGVQLYTQYLASSGLEIAWKLSRIFPSLTLAHPIFYSFHCPPVVDILYFEFVNYIAIFKQYKNYSMSFDNKMTIHDEIYMLQTANQYDWCILATNFPIVYFL